MKALSLLPEPAHYVWTGEKTVECRTWQTNYRGDLLICANSIRQKGFISGHALAVVELKEIVPFTPDHLNDACMKRMPDIRSYAWIFGNVREIIPFPQKGTPQLFDVDDRLIRYVSIHSDTEADAFFEEYCLPLFLKAGLEVSST